MIFGKKQPEMFDAFRQKGDKPGDPKTPEGSKPGPKPADLKPPVPIPGMNKPPVKPFGGQTGGSKRIVPELKEAKPLSSKPAETPPAGPPKAPEPKLFDDKPATPRASDPKPAPASAPSAQPPSPAAAAPKPAPMPGVTRPAPVKFASQPSMPSALSGLRDAKDVHVVELGTKSEVVFGMSYSALIWTAVIAFAAVVLVVVLAVSLFRGKSTPAMPKAGGGAIVKPEDATGRPSDGTGTATTIFPAGTYYSVQVLTVPNDPTRLRELDDVIRFLSGQMNVQPLVKYTPKTGSQVTLWAGAFTREQKSEAEKLAARLRLMTFRGRNEFKTAKEFPIP